MDNLIHNKRTFAHSQRHKHRKECEDSLQIHVHNIGGDVRRRRELVDRVIHHGVLGIVNHRGKRRRQGDRRFSANGNCVFRSASVTPPDNSDGSKTCRYRLHKSMKQNNTPNAADVPLKSTCRSFFSSAPRQHCLRSRGRPPGEEWIPAYRRCDASCRRSLIRRGDPGILVTWYRL